MSTGDPMLLGPRVVGDRVLQSPAKLAQSANRIGVDRSENAFDGEQDAIEIGGVVRQIEVSPQIAGLDQLGDQGTQILPEEVGEDGRPETSKHEQLEQRIGRSVFVGAAHPVRGRLLPRWVVGEVASHPFIDEGAHAGGEDLEGLGHLGMPAERQTGGSRAFGCHEEMRPPFRQMRRSMTWQRPWTPRFDSVSAVVGRT